MMLSFLERPLLPSPAEIREPLPYRRVRHLAASDDDTRAMHRRIALQPPAGFSTAPLEHVARIPGYGCRRSAGRLRSRWTVAVEARLPLLATAMAGFS